MSISADGAIIQWDANSGQQLHGLPPHTLGLVSLSVSEAGDRAVYNTLEGLTQLWDLIDGSVLGRHESFARDPGATQQIEPGVCIYQLCNLIIIHHTRIYAFVISRAVWTVSLHPKGETYASTGGDGKVTIRSAAAADFGTPAQQLLPGKSRFGMSLAHVSFTFNFRRAAR